MVKLTRFDPVEMIDDAEAVAAFLADAFDTGDGDSAMTLAREAEALAAKRLEPEAVAKALAERRLSDVAVLEELTYVEKDQSQVRAILRCGLVQITAKVAQADVQAFEFGQEVLIRGNVVGFQPWNFKPKPVQDRAVPWKHLTIRLGDAEIYGY